MQFTNGRRECGRKGENKIYTLEKNLLDISLFEVWLERVNEVT